MKRLNIRWVIGGPGGAAMFWTARRGGRASVASMTLSAIVLLAVVATGCGGTGGRDIGGDLGPTDSNTPADVADMLAGDTAVDARDVAGLDAAADGTNDSTSDAYGDLPGDANVDTTIDLPWDSTPTHDGYIDVPWDSTPDAQNDVPTDIPTDIPTDLPPDAQQCGGVWRLVDVAPESAALADPAGLNAARSTRIAVVAVLKCSQDRGMPTVVVDAVARTVTIQPRNWELQGFHCMGPDLLDTRIITVRPAAAGDWQVRTPDGTVLTTFTVDAAPPTDCAADSHSDCIADCDCAAGVCLGGFGLVGPFTACALPCEDSRDCPSGNSCISADDGLDHYCDPTQECLNSDTCPLGFTCESKFCVINYTLNQAARHECTCNDDCEPPLRCVEPDDAGGTRRCEYACPTDGGWCPGAHVCGPASADLAGLAQTDSVCGWLGE